MRLAFILPTFDESANSFSKLLVPILNALIARGDEVVVYSANKNYVGPFPHIALTTLKTRIAFISFFFFVIAATLRVLKDNFNCKFDVIHNLGGGSSLIQNCITAHACHAAWVKRKRLYGEGWKVFANPLHALILLVERRNYRQRDTRVIAVSESVADEVRNHYKGALPIVIPNGLPKAKFQDLKAASPITRSGCFTIGFAGNYFEHKGLRPLMYAASIARLEGRSWKIIVMGGDDAKPWQRLASRLGLDVVFTGHIQDISHSLRSCDAFCMPSKYESFGLVYLEAAALGIPIVATPVGIAPTLLGSQFASFIITHPVSDSDVANCIKRLEDDKSLCETYSKHLQMVAVVFSEETMVENTLAVYDTLSLAKNSRSNLGLTRSREVIS